jgi:hypothetical protein
VHRAVRLVADERKTIICPFDEIAGSKLSPLPSVPLECTETHLVVFRAAVTHKYMIESVVALAADQVRRGGIEGDELAVGRDRWRTASLVALIIIGVH